jgi:hypothetical protein
MLFVEVEVMLGEVQTEQQFLAGEEPSGFGRRTYLVIRWQGQGILLFPVNRTRSITQHVSTEKSAVPVFNRFTEHGILKLIERLHPPGHQPRGTILSK